MKVNQEAVEKKNFEKKHAEQKHVEQKNTEQLTDQKIQEWKRKWGKLYKTTIGNEAFIWRKLKRKEYVAIMSTIPGEEAEEVAEVGSRIYQRQEMITKLVVLYPFNIEQRIEEDAGLATSIADEVILKSGFDVKATEEL